MPEDFHGAIILMAHVSIQGFIGMVTVLLSMSDKYSQKKQERRTSKFF